MDVGTTLKQHLVQHVQRLLFDGYGCISRLPISSNYNSSVVIKLTFITKSSKHREFTQCCFNVGPPSSTEIAGIHPMLFQCWSTVFDWNSIGWMFRVCWITMPSMSALQTQTAATVYLKSKQSLLFVLVLQISPVDWHFPFDFVCSCSEFESAWECLPCHTECHGCWGGASTQCAACPAGRVFLRGECLLACPLGHYPDRQAQCMRCHHTCLSCTGR